MWRLGSIIQATQATRGLESSPLCWQVQSVTRCTRGRISLNHLNVKVLIAQLCLTLCNPMDCSLPGSPLSMEFSRQEYWSSLPFSSPEDLPKLGIKPGSPVLQADSLQSEPPGKPLNHLLGLKIWKRPNLQG